MSTLQAIPPVIDLTLLDSQATKHQIETLAAKGVQHHVAAICILPKHLDDIPKTTIITRAAAVNFPSGQEPHHLVLKAIEQIATEHQVDEVDYVFPWSAYLRGDVDYALTCCRQACELAQKHQLIFKVILETGALPSPELIYQLALNVILRTSCDFIKSSTGKIETGITIEAEKAMLSAMIDSKRPCGIKLSGGIRTMEQALTFISLAEEMMGRSVNKTWFRLGASGLLDEIALIQDTTLNQPEQV